MAPKLVKLEEAAALLGLTPEVLNEKRQAGEIYAMRDGGTWKFKMDEVERYAAEKGATLGSAEASPAANFENLFEQGGPDSILVSEEELGHSGETTSSTIIGRSDKKAQASDESDIKLSTESKKSPGASDVILSTSGIGKGSDVLGKGSGLKLDGLEDLLGSKLSLEGSGTGSGTGSKKPPSRKKSGEDSVVLGEEKPSAGPGTGSVIDLGDADDLLLGSDVTHSPGDSGIGLASPADSGLSLEDEPLELGGSVVESLELPEDDMITLEEDADTDAPTQLKADDDFLLSPISDSSNDESSSGSQVIAIESEEGFSTDRDAILSGGAGALMEEIQQDEMLIGTDVGLAGQAGLAPVMTAAAPPEAPYSVWNIVALSALVLFMSFSAVLTFDLLRGVHRWEGNMVFEGKLMDNVVSMFGGMFGGK